MVEDTFSVADSMRNLEQTFSRGLSTGWLEGTNPHGLVSGDVTSHRGTRLGTVLEVRRDAAVVKLNAPVRCGDGVVFENTDKPEHSQGGRVYEIIRRKESVKEAEGGAKVLLTFANNSIDAQYVAEHQTVWKTDDPRRQRAIQKTWKTSQPHRRVPLDIKVRAEVGKPIEFFVSNKLGANIRLIGTDNLEPARKHPLTWEMLREQLDRLGGTIYSLGNVEADIVGGPMVPLSVLGTLRHEMLTRLDEYPMDKPYAVTEYTLEPTVGSRQSAAEYLAGTPALATIPALHILFRESAHFEEETLVKWTEIGCRSFYAELCSMEDYKRAAAAIRNVSAEFVAVLPRIVKPGESKFLHKIADLQPDAVLARNLEELVFFRDRNVPVIVDFSLNVINDIAFYQMLDWGAERITFGLDVNEEQMQNLLQLVPPERVEQIVVGRVPLFTMEHCLWRTQFLQPEEPCEKLCRKQSLTIEDRYGALHTVRSDIFCRNIVERSEPIESAPLVSHLRIEWDDRIQNLDQKVKALAGETKAEKSNF